MNNNLSKIKATFDSYLESASNEELETLLDECAEEYGSEILTIFQWRAEVSYGPISPPDTAHPIKMGSFAPHFLF